MKNIDKKLLTDFLKLAGEKLSGEWVLIGGTVLPVLDFDHRVTVDIDLIGLTNFERSQSLKLMEVAETLGLPIEAINQAGAFFLEKQAPYRDRLIVLHRGTNATIFRPSLLLFVQLKVARFTESDLADCLEFLKRAKKLEESVDLKALREAVESELEKTDSKEKKSRLITLLRRIR